MGTGVGDRIYRAKIDCIFCQHVELRVHALRVFHRPETTLLSMDGAVSTLAKKITSLF